MASRAIDPNHHPELIGERVFLAPGCTLVGRVSVGDESSLWFGAVVRGDTEWVQIGKRSNVQDLAVLHADPGFPCRIGDDVTIGHAAVVHGATVRDGAMIGIGAVILNGAVVGERAIVGAGSLVPEGREIPPGHLAVGSPARVVRELSEEDFLRLANTAAHYVEAAAAFQAAAFQAAHAKPADRAAGQAG